MRKKHRPPLISAVALISAVGLLIAGLALSACGASSEQQGQLAAITTAGTPLVPATHGSGNRDLGTFAGGGHVTVAVTCVGPGAVHVTLKGADLTVTAPCVPSRSKTGGSQSATARVAVPANSAFAVQVAGGSTDHWIVAVSEDATPAS